MNVSSVFRTIFLPLLGLDLHLSPMTRSISEIQVLLANEFLSGHFAVGIINFLESIEGLLVASLGRNLPVTDSDFMIAKVVVFEAADVVAGRNFSSQCAYSLEQSGPLLIDGYSDAFAVSNPSFCAKLRSSLAIPYCPLK